MTKRRADDVWVFLTLETIRQIGSRNAKEHLLRGMLEKDEELTREVFKYASYPFWNYGVRVPERNYPLSGVPKLPNAWDLFKECLDKLKSGKYTGNRARDEVSSLLNHVSPFLAHWFMCILNQDLNIGISTQTIKKFMPGLLPDTDPMLCDKLDITDVSAVKSKTGWILEPKYDGLRALAFVQEGTVTFISRRGKDLWNVEHIQEQLLSLGITNAVFDGELLAENWNQTISIVHTRIKHTHREKLNYHIFDTIPLKQWTERKTSPLAVRKVLLSKVLIPSGLKNLKFVPYAQVDGELVDEMKKLVSEGYEGGVLKNPASQYEWKRSGNWLKVKPVHESDFEVYGYEEGEGRHEDSLGALKIRGKVNYKGRDYLIDTKVGSGFSDADRDKLWTKRKTLAGKIVQVEFQEVATQKKYDPRTAHALRFPVFVRVRTDK